MSITASITAQDLYDYRELYSHIDGNDLHWLFQEVCGEPSPRGSTPIDPLKLHAIAPDSFDIAARRGTSVPDVYNFIIYFFEELERQRRSC